MSDTNENAAKPVEQTPADQSAPATPNVHKLSEEELGKVSGGLANASQKEELKK